MAQTKTQKKTPQTLPLPPPQLPSLLSSLPPCHSSDQYTDHSITQLTNIHSHTEHHMSVCVCTLGFVTVKPTNVTKLNEDSPVLSFFLLFLLRPASPPLFRTQLYIPSFSNSPCIVLFQNKKNPHYVVNYIIIIKYLVLNLYSLPPPISSSFM